MVLVDSNVLLDVITSDPKWLDWSVNRLESSLSQGLAINPIVYAELTAAFHRSDELDRALDFSELKRLPLPYTAAFRAGRVFLEYRRRGGGRLSPLPDFFIGAHAEVEGLMILTRDAKRYRTYFPKVRLIAPD
jgi:predicted nucleic acid-binding protein